MFSLFVSQYPTFLLFLGVFVAMALTLALMPAWIKFLRKEHFGQQVRDDGPQTHLVKQGTPTMGGVVMLIAVVLTMLFVADITPEAIVLVGAVVGFLTVRTHPVHRWSDGAPFTIRPWT